MRSFTTLSLMLLFLSPFCGAATLDCNLLLANGAANIEAGGTQNHPLYDAWLPANAKIALIQSEVGKLSSFEQLYFKPIANAAVAAVTKHQRMLLKELDLTKFNIPRHRAILKSITEFDSGRVKYSLYKIKRAIEESHSLQEYMDCREGP